MVTKRRDSVGVNPREQRQLCEDIAKNVTMIKFSITEGSIDWMVSDALFAFLECFKTRMYNKIESRLPERPCHQTISHALKSLAINPTDLIPWKILSLKYIEASEYKKAYQACCDASEHLIDGDEYSTCITYDPIFSLLCGGRGDPNGITAGELRRLFNEAKKRDEQAKEIFGETLRFSKDFVLYMTKKTAKQSDDTVELTDFRDVAVVKPFITVVPYARKTIGKNTNQIVMFQKHTQHQFN
eukprot:TRINITY_DN9184_c0_g1_i1.p1 TRINITY_DN9184_c0_g1~~TRINITY_DN9184_c0_g1_i1.p1  ORF type:complete len:242 (-),score=31.77 TRINITY_DN9184_c0_g1_i1:367-1092(-)